MAHEVSKETRPALRGGWRLLRLFSVGMAWGAPFILLAFMEPSVAAHARLVAVLSPRRPLLALLMPLSAVGGVVLVGSLSPRPPRMTGSAALVFVAAIGWPVLLDLAASILLPMFAFLPFRAFQAGFVVFFAFEIAMGIEAIAFVAIGVVVTLATFWRRGSWLVPIWLLAWGLLCGVLYTAAQTTGAGGGFGAGLLVIGLVVALVGTCLVAVFALDSLRARDQPPVALSSGGLAEK
jgi:hypothetical protein